MIRRYTDLCSACEDADSTAAAVAKRAAFDEQRKTVQNTEQTLEGALRELAEKGVPMFRRRIITAEKKRLFGGQHREWEDVEAAYDIGAAEWDCRETSSSGPKRMMPTGVTVAGEVVWLGVIQQDRDWGDVSKIYPIPSTRDSLKAFAVSGGEPRRCRLSREELASRLSALLR